MSGFNFQKTHNFRNLFVYTHNNVVAILLNDYTKKNDNRRKQKWEIISFLQFSPTLEFFKAIFELFLYFFIIIFHFSCNRYFFRKFRQICGNIFNDNKHYVIPIPCFVLPRKLHSSNFLLSNTAFFSIICYC